MKAMLMKRNVSLVASMTLAMMAWPCAARGDEPQAPSARTEPVEKAQPAPGGINGRFAVTGGYGRIFSIPFYGVGVGAELGSDVTRSVGIYGGLYYERARTEYGLPINFGTLGITVEGIFDRLRLGAGIHGTYFGLIRISNDSDLDKLGIGLHFTLSVDIIHSREFNLYIGVRPQFDILGKAKPLTAQLALGIRF